MIFIQTQAYLGIWSGAVIMIALHNMFVSIIMYKSRQTNASNLLKIIFNFGLIVRIGATFGLYMTPQVATYTQCIVLLQLTMVGNVITRVSLSVFLLWRLRQIRNVNNYSSDKWISIILITVKIALVIPYFIYQRVSTDYVPEVDVVICNINDPSPLPYAITGTIVEFIIDIFVTVRLVQTLRNANKNAAQVSTNIKSKRTLFTAVMYWNFLRLFVAIVFHLLAVLDMIHIDYSELREITSKWLISIILSYVITVDAEIVRVIEGRDNKKGSSAGSKSFKSMNSHGNDLPKYSPYDQTRSTHSQVEDNKIAVVSMKRLSFFEWANVVVGKRIRKDGDREEEEEDVEYNDEDVEEIIDGPSKSSKDDDLEKDLSQDRRNSNFSGTTSVTESTLDDNPDIVIH